jgi:hypothetical protein
MFRAALAFRLSAACRFICRKPVPNPIEVIVETPMVAKVA